MTSIEHMHSDGLECGTFYFVPFGTSAGEWDGMGSYLFSSMAGCCCSCFNFGCSIAGFTQTNTRFLQTYIPFLISCIFLALVLQKREKLTTSLFHPFLCPVERMFALWESSRAALSLISLFLIPDCRKDEYV
jgi:hypothetical protein